MRIAIIGTGISGNVAAHFLSNAHDITVYERRDRLGGHSATKRVDLPDGPQPVDTGFIVYNPLNYPGLIKLFAELDVATEDSNMSFAFSDSQTGLEWSGQSLSTLFAQRRNLVNPRFWFLLWSILRFNKLAAAAHEAGLSPDLSLGDWLDAHAFGTDFRNRYLLPMGAAIWSTPAEDILNFPARSFIHFFVNHRLIHRERPQWRTVSGGSQTYVEKLTASFADRVKLSAEVTEIRRTQDGVCVTANGETEIYDEVVCAAHSDQTLAMLADASSAETEILSAIRYLPNQVYLHADTSLMPRNRKTWSAWNYMSHGSHSPVMTVSYWMNRLQNIDERHPLFVTLNPLTPPAADKTYGHYVYDHPQYDRDALLAQARLDAIQGTNKIWFCGAWTGYGFHEDGLQSALRVVEAIDRRRSGDPTLAARSAAE